jgi:hypothetical protein
MAVHGGDSTSKRVQRAGYYSLVLRRAARLTLERSREHLTRLAIGLTTLAIVGTCLTRFVPLFANGNQARIQVLLDDLRLNTLADLTVTFAYFLIGSILVYLWNVVRTPALLYAEIEQQAVQSSDESDLLHGQLDAVLQNPAHMEHLRNALRLVPKGPPGQANVIYDALREHLYDSSIWNEQAKLRALVDDSVLGPQAATERLIIELRAARLAPNHRGATGLDLLAERTKAACKGEDTPFPDKEWSIDISPPIPLFDPDGYWSGPFLLHGTVVIAKVQTFAEAMCAIMAFHAIWDDIPTWREVLRVANANQELPLARETLDRHIAGLLLHPQFPGRCHFCLPRPSGSRT